MNGTAYVAHLPRGNTHLGADVDIGLKFVEHLAQVLLRLPIAIHGSRVEVINTGLNGPRHRTHAGTRLLTDDQATDVAAAKAECGNAQSGLAKCAIFHDVASPLNIASPCHCVGRGGPLNWPPSPQAPHPNSISRQVHVDA